MHCIRNNQTREPKHMQNHNQQEKLQILNHKSKHSSPTQKQSHLKKPIKPKINFLFERGKHNKKPTKQDKNCLEPLFPTFSMSARSSYN